MYDQHSARLLRSTDWKRLGALRNPPHSVRQWGKALNAAELAALGRARLTASTQVHASDTFWQHHPADQRAYILCAARVSSAEPGWEILLLDDGQRPIWSLKGDRGAELKCDCHCNWNESCPGVVSVPAGSVGKTDSIRRDDSFHPSMPSTAEPEQVASVPDGWRWPGEADRGVLHGQQEAHHEYQSSPALPVPQSSPARRRGFFAALFGGAAAAPAVVEAAAPSVPTAWNWPEPAAGSEYRGQLHEPPAPAIEQEWQWPASLPGSAFESPNAIEHHGAPWDVPALPAPDTTMIGWDAPWPVWSDPEPSYAALPAPEAEPLSTQAEIDTFIEIAWETSPVIEPAPDYDVPALPPSEK
jgi:hypothetical protein